MFVCFFKTYHTHILGSTSILCFFLGLHKVRTLVLQTKMINLKSCSFFFFSKITKIDAISKIRSDRLVTSLHGRAVQLIRC